MVFAKSIPVSLGVSSLNTLGSDEREHPGTSNRTAGNKSCLRRCSRHDQGVFFGMTQQHLSRVINLISERSQRFWTIDESEARRRLLASDAEGVLEIDGSFALVVQDGERVLLARSLDRPLRYFLAKAVEGPALIVAERIDEIAGELARRGWSAQFHPSYTRMVPAHHVTTLRLVGCPDPNPVHRRFFDPPRGILPADLDVIGKRYIEALYSEIRRWLKVQDRSSPIGVPFSGGIDSGSVLLCLYRAMLDEGQSPARLKAFTLSIDGEGDDAR